jgi:hypothetical protein
MTSIGGVGGPGGPSGPGGPGGADRPDGPGAADGTGAIDEQAPAADAGAAGGVEGGVAAEGGDPIARMAADLDAGRITPEEAMARLVDQSVAGLPPAEQAEMRSLMEDLIASDPYLGGLLGIEPGGR